MSNVAIHCQLSGRHMKIHNPEDDMQILRLVYKHDEYHVSKVILKDPPFGVGDENDLIEFAKTKIDSETYDHLLAAKAFHLGIDQEPIPFEVYAVHNCRNPRVPMKFSQFIGKRKIGGVDYVTWADLESLDEDWMLIGEKLYGPPGKVVVDYPEGSDRIPTVIARVERI